MFLSRIWAARARRCRSSARPARAASTTPGRQLVRPSAARVRRQRPDDRDGDRTYVPPSAPRTVRFAPREIAHNPGVDFGNLPQSRWSTRRSNGPAYRVRETELPDPFAPSRRGPHHGRPSERGNWRSELTDPDELGSARPTAPEAANLRVPAGGKSSLRSDRFGRSLAVSSLETQTHDESWHPTWAPSSAAGATAARRSRDPQRCRSAIARLRFGRVASVRTAPRQTAPSVTQQPPRPSSPDCCNRTTWATRDARPDSAAFTKHRQRRPVPNHRLRLLDRLQAAATTRAARLGRR